jgi:hypothetical protein
MFSPLSFIHELFLPSFCVIFLFGMFIIRFFRYMGFPLIDQPSTDISRYFYIASKFIENGINSGGEETKAATNKRSFDSTCFSFLSFPRKQEKF